MAMTFGQLGMAAKDGYLVLAKYLQGEGFVYEGDDMVVDDFAEPETEAYGLITDVLDYLNEIGADSMDVIERVKRKAWGG